jgi:hypothetical protein
MPRERLTAEHHGEHGAGFDTQGTPRHDHPILAAGLVISNSSLRGRRHAKQMLRFKGVA